MNYISNMIGFPSKFKLFRCFLESKFNPIQHHTHTHRKLHHYQVQNKEILSGNKTLAQMADRINLHNMQTLSEHLIHVMDHLYELHQLNKKNLRLILE